MHDIAQQQNDGGIFLHVDPAGLRTEEARMAQSAPAERLEQVVRKYIQACNDADAEAIAGCFCPDAVHYLPHWPKWSGSATIGRNFADNFQKQGLRWTVDQLVTG